MKPKYNFVGSVFELRVPSMGNTVGTKGICFYDYETGIQVIFENGEYCGYDLMEKKLMTADGKCVDECKFWLKPVGISLPLINYRFKNVMQVMDDFRWKIFNFNDFKRL